MGVLGLSKKLLPFGPIKFTVSTTRNLKLNGLKLEGQNSKSVLVMPVSNLRNSRVVPVLDQGYFRTHFVSSKDFVINWY